MSGGALLILLAAAAPGQSQQQKTSAHDQEISGFASTMAIARTFAETCGGSVNDSYLEDLRRRLHVVERDHPIFAGRARDVVAHLQEGLFKAPSRAAWCDSLYALYGPNGSMIPGLLQR